MAKRQTRRSISVSRSTYERLRAYCETNGISMSQFVEHRVGDFLGRSIRRPGGLGDERPVELVTSAPASTAAPTPMTAPAMAAPPMTAPPAPRPAPAPTTAAPAPATRSTIVPRPAPAAPPPAKLTPDRIFTF